MPPFEPNEIEQLFPDLDTPPTPQAEPTPEPTPAPEPARIDPNIAALQQQVGQLTNLVTGMFQQGFQRPQQPEPKPEPKPQYFTDADVEALLTHPDKSTTFNALARKIEENVANPLRQQLEQTTARLSAYEQEQLQARRQAEISQQAAANLEQFTSTYPEFKGMEEDIAFAAQQLDRQGRANPHMLMGKTNQELAQMLADSLRKKMTFMAERVNGQQEQPATPVRNAFMERGGTSRAPTQPQAKDPNTKALVEMSTFMKGGQQRRRA